MKFKSKFISKLFLVVVVVVVVVVLVVVVDVGKVFKQRYLANSWSGVSKQVCGNAECEVSPPTATQLRCSVNHCIEVRHGRIAIKGQDGHCGVAENDH